MTMTAENNPQVLIENKLSTVKNFCGDNFNNKSITQHAIDFMESATGYDFGFKTNISFYINYIGVNWDVTLEVIIHYDNSSKECYECLYDVYHKTGECKGETESMVICFSKLTSVIDMFETDVLEMFHD